MKIYIAGPLYSQGERDFNLKVDATLKELGHQTYLPQRDGGIVSQMPEYINGIEKHRYVYELDLKEMTTADCFLYILDGRVPDEGAAVALGYCTALGKKCIGFKTDSRNLSDGEDNLMIAMSLEVLLHGFEALKDYFKS